jgi:ankyrin repeat protein
LLDAGVDVHDPEIQENGLMIATQKPDFEIAKLLLERGADPNGDGKLLSIMAEAGQVGAVLFLLDAGADPNRSRRSGGPALFGAANNFNVEMVLALLAKGADVNARDGRDRTPIFRVAQYNEPAAAEMIRVLAEHGADLNARNGEGQTPLEFAKAEGGPLSVAALEAAAKAGKKK